MIVTIARGRMDGVMIFAPTVLKRLKSFWNHNMNRRTFLKYIATACGAAVVCPGELLKDESELKPGWYDVPVFTEEQRKKYRQNIFVKARQQGCTNSTFYTMYNFDGRRSGYIITKP